MIILLNFIPLQLVYIQYVYHVFRWMFCTMPMCHQEWYNNCVHPLWGCQRNLSFQDYFQHHRKKEELTEHGEWNLAINDQGWEGDSNSHYVSLMNTYKWYYSCCIISIYSIEFYALYFTHFQLFQFALSHFAYFNLHSAEISIILILCMETVKDYWHIWGVRQESIAIVCHFHLLWILTRRFKIWGTIFFNIMRQRWCCLYHLPQTIWLGMCQCILKFGSWIVQQVSGDMHLNFFVTNLY